MRLETWALVFALLVPGCGDDDVDAPSDASVPALTRFEFLGPRGVGYLHSFVFDPRSPSTVYAGGDDGNGVFRSRDGGETWAQLDALGVRSGWALAIGANGRLYVGDWYGTGIFVSDDGGETFRHSEGVDFPFSYIASIAAHPSDPNVAFAVAGFGDGTSDGANGDAQAIGTRGALYRTEDGGAHWDRLQAPVEGPLTDVALQPTAADHVLVASATGIWRSTNRGDDFEQVSSTAGGTIAFSRADDDVVIAAGDRIVRSDDGGATWEPTSAPPGFYLGVAASPSTDAFFAFGTTELGAALVKSVGTMGTTWDAVVDPLYAGLHLGGAVDPRDEDTLLVGTFGEGIVRYTVTNDAWTSSSEGTFGAECDGVVGGTDRLVVACGNLTFAPYVAYSDDDGASWTMAEGPFDPGGLDVVIPLVVDVDDPNVLVVGGNTLRRSVDGGETWATIVDSHSFALAQAGDGAIYAAGMPFLRSIDHGASFDPYGEIPCDAWHVAADPHAPGRVLASCPDEGFYSTSDGQRWERVELDAPDGYAYSSLVFDPGAEGHWAAAFSVSEGARLAGQVRVTSDSGATWRDVTPDMTCRYVAAILYLSDRPGHLLVGTQSADHYCPEIDGALFESFDDGSTWRDATENLEPPQIHAGGLFEGRDGVVYVSTWDGGIFRRQR